MNLATKLTSLSNKAIAESYAAIQLEQQRRDESAARETRRAIQAAEIIMDGLEEKLVKAANEGAKTYAVLKLDYRDYSQGSNFGNSLSLFQVSSIKVRHVYETLEAKGLQPYFDFGHDGVGISSWFTLCVKWD